MFPAPQLMVGDFEQRTASQPNGANYESRGTNNFGVGFNIFSDGCNRKPEQPCA